ncbi:ThiF family adenylyltransferase [Sediminibacterium sp.]|uniref:HesA/MoeB/ThiF family protein n=1 Tax=Sediminibacterium sp. TaxID=1917865 RepID=UPI0027308D91|nr:ThiF family adenylyltransferase [Sediminibacterium sp.]MDP2421336.1 ThiF family adenylyltransferase [Sediminibacterium sp.]
MNQIRITQKEYNILRAHLFPGDGKEAVAIALCGRLSNGSQHVLCVQEILCVPHDACFERKPDRVSWPTDVVNPLLEKATGRGWAIIKFHSHPGYYEQFSEVDDYSDSQLFPSIHSWLNDGLPHASCIMLPDGRLFGRFFDENNHVSQIDLIAVTGPDLTFWNYRQEKDYRTNLQTRNLQAFGKGTVAVLRQLKVGVVGCSGTGSPTIEQLKRLGVGEIVMVDPDYIDFLNLNRIINSTLQDAEHKVPKTVVMKRAIDETGFGTTATCYEQSMISRPIVKALAGCDVLFSCVDSVEARHVLNMISSFYLVPLFDMGVDLKADGKGGIETINGIVHYIQPGGSSLFSRGQYTMEALRSESIRRLDPEEALRNQYLAAVGESSPAVISINMQVAATAVNEFLARIHPYRTMDNAEVDAVAIMFNEATTFPQSFPGPCPFFSKYKGAGDAEPLLNNPELTDHEMD